MGLTNSLNNAAFSYPSAKGSSLYIKVCNILQEEQVLFIYSYDMMPGSKGQKAVHACMIRLLNLGPAKHEEEVICVANQRIPNVCRIAGAACCGAIRGRQLGAKDLLTPTS